MRRRISIGTLGVVDEQHIADAPDLLHAMRKTGKAAQTLLQQVATDTERERRGRGTGCILRVVQTAQRADAGNGCDLAAYATLCAHDRVVLDIHTVGDRMRDGDAHDALAGLVEPVSGSV